MNVRKGQAFANEEHPGFEGFLEGVDGSFDTAKMVEMRLWRNGSREVPKKGPGIAIALLFALV